MKRYIAMLMLGLVGIAASVGGPGAQTPQQQTPDWPDWAYGYLTPLSADDRLAPTCARGRQSSLLPAPTEPEPDDGIQRTLSGTTESFTSNEIAYGYGPVDWYPGDHPPMPEIVAHGKESAGIRACGLCHYPNGQGKMENGHVAGLPAEYILQQLEAFENATATMPTRARRTPMKWRGCPGASPTPRKKRSPSTSRLSIFALGFVW